MSESRQPKGIPAGGQFTPTTHGEPAVVLDVPPTEKDIRNLLFSEEAFDAVINGAGTPDERRQAVRDVIGPGADGVSDEHLDDAIAAVSKAHSRYPTKPGFIASDVGTHIRLDEAARNYKARNEMDPAQPYDLIYKNRVSPENKHDYARRALNGAHMSGAFDGFTEAERATIIACTWDQQQTNAAVVGLEPIKTKFRPDEFATKLAEQILADDAARRAKP